MALLIQRAQKKETYMLVSLMGPTNSGKTATMLRMLIAISKRLGKPFGVVETEKGRATKFIGFKNADGGRIEEFDQVLLVDDYSPERYIEALQLFVDGGYCAVGIDSLSHEYIGEGGILNIVDKSESQKGGKFVSGWGKATPKHNAFIDGLMKAKIHRICTIREEMKYEIDQSTKKVVNLGLEPVQRTGKTDIRYEFDIGCKIDENHVLTVVKQPPSDLFRDYSEKEPGAKFANLILDWLREDAVTLESQVAAEKASKGALLRKTHDEISGLIQKAAAYMTPQQKAAMDTQYKSLGDDQGKLEILKTSLIKRLSDLEVKAAMEPPAGVVVGEATPEAKAALEQALEKLDNGTA